MIQSVLCVVLYCVVLCWNWELPAIVVLAVADVDANVVVVVVVVVTDVDGAEERLDGLLSYFAVRLLADERWEDLDLGSIVFA